MKFRISLITICVGVGLFLAFSYAFAAIPADDPLVTTGASGELPAEPLSMNWIDAQQSDGIAYFLFESFPRIERYDLEARRWLSTTYFDAIPSAFTVDQTGLYVGFGRRVSRFNLDGSNEQHLRNTDTDVVSLHTTDRFLYINYSSYPYGKLQSINKLTGELVDNKSYLYAVLNGPDIAVTTGKLFARDSGISPSDIVQITLNDDGTLGGEIESPYHGDYPRATRVYVLPGDSRVVDNAGIIYNAADLTYSNSLGGGFDDIAFYGDLPIVRRGNQLFSYSNAFLETGIYTPHYTPTKIFIHQAEIRSFYPETTTIGVETIPINLLTPAKPGEPIDPTGLAYTPDQIILGKGEIVYLLSRSLQSIFRWSAEQHQYLETIPLSEAPTYMAYSQENDRLYLAYPSGKITQITVAKSTTEDVFANAPLPPCGLATAGEFVFACVPVGAWVSHFTYEPTGQVISQVEWNYRSAEYIWSAANRKMYFFRDDTSPNDLLWEEINTNGEIGEQLDSPYHSSTGILHPIRVSPEGNFVLLGSGRIYNASSLQQIDSLSNNIIDATWLNSRLFTLRITASEVSRAADNDNQLQKWGQNYSLDKVRDLNGTSGRLFPISQGLLVISQYQDAPWFSIWDSDLNEVYETGDADFFATPLAGSAPLTVTFTNTTVGSNATQFMWDFGDTSTSTIENPTHVFTATGSYTVTFSLILQPSENMTATKKSYINVSRYFYLPFIAN